MSDYDERGGAGTSVDIEMGSALRSSRDRVVLFLLFLTSEKCVEALKRRIPADRVVFEFCRLWFDEIYTPSARYMDGLKGDVSRERVAAFAQHFDEDELAALERFNAFLDLRIDMLSDAQRASRTFPENDMWRNIVRDAGYLVEDLEPDAAVRRRLVDWLAESLARGKRSLKLLVAMVE